MSLFTPLREAQQPLLFLYPEWFRLDSSRRYHTESKPGPGRTSRLPRTLLCRASRNDEAFKHSRLFARPISQQFSRNEATRETEAVSEENEADHESFTASDEELGSKVRKVDIASSVLVRRVGSQRGKSSDSSSYYQRPVDAERIFSLLLAVQPDKRSMNENTSRFKVSTKIVRSIQGSSQANTWVRYSARSGCTVVRVLPGSHNGETTIELVGSDAGQESVKNLLFSGAYAEQKANEAWIRETTKHSNTQSPRPPPTWTLQSFHRYVKALTQPRSRRSAMRHIYQADQSHNLAIGRLLVNLFTSLETAPFASTRAVYEALQFCRRHPELSNIAVRLWDAADALGLDLSISCFNVELGRCLVVKNGNRFYDLVREMSSRGIQPDGDTWALALSYAENPHTRSRILNFLKEKGLLQSPRDKAKIVDMIVKKDIHTYLQKPQGISEFKKHMDENLGTSWLTPRAVSRLLRACRIAKAYTTQASDILAMAEKVGDPAHVLGKGGFLNLLHVATKAGSLHDALEIVKSKAGSEQLFLQQAAIDLLFKLAWRRQCPNLCRLLWFRASTSGMITFSMQKLVLTSLTTNTGSSQDKELDTWLRVAGKLIIGTNLNREGMQELFPQLFSNRQLGSPIEALIPFTKSYTLRHEQMQLSQLLIERDLSAWRFYEPIPLQRLNALFDEALNQDTQWRLSKKLYSTTPEKLLSDVLQIPLSARPSPIKNVSMTHDQEERRKWFIVNGHRLDYNTLTYGTTKGVSVDAKAKTKARAKARAALKQTPRHPSTSAEKNSTSTAIVNDAQKGNVQISESDKREYEKWEVDVQPTQHHSNPTNSAYGLA